ncbi:hypothetical protein PR048_025362 [Dryococelus australis]|uniref:Uncharacterized protein n=1 Tax=Dryococelus australis TaxID=614101 RepID=A0ABQ9GR29_9NEOP|nr:hypothetical protein PR048_025362 [Dryococelus australis]
MRSRFETGEGLCVGLHVARSLYAHRSLSRRGVKLRGFGPRFKYPVVFECRGKREIPRERPADQRKSFPHCENPVARPGVEPGSPWWEASIHAARREHCTSVQILARSGDVVLGVCDKVALTAKGYSRNRSERVHLDPRCRRLRLLDVSAAVVPGTYLSWLFLEGRPLTDVLTASRWPLAPRRASRCHTSAQCLESRHISCVGFLIFTASSSKIPACENPVTRPGIEPSSPWWGVNRVRVPAGSLPGFWHVGNYAELCRWSAGFLGELPFPRSCIPTLLHTRLASPSSAVNTSMLGAPKYLRFAVRRSSITTTPQAICSVDVDTNTAHFPITRGRGGVVVRPPKRTSFDSRRGPLPGFRRAGLCRWSAGFLGDFPFLPALQFPRCSVLT